MRICDNNYDDEDREKFKQYPYEYAITGIINRNNVLITCLYNQTQQNFLKQYSIHLIVILILKNNVNVFLEN